MLSPEWLYDNETDCVATQLAEQADERPVVAAVSPEETNADDQLGWIGNFRLVRELARGAQGVLYEAQQSRPSRRVALKTMTVHTVDDQQARTRFEEEGRILAHVEHPSVVPVYATGTFHGHAWIAMKLLSGRDLASVIGDLPPEAGRVITRQEWLAATGCDEEALADWTDYPRIVGTILRDVARALEACHSRGILHRDVKPANLMLERTGSVVLTDFGLARPDRDRTNRLTRGIVGTLPYIPPEVAVLEGPEQRADARGDLYSLGVTGYELLVRRRPYADCERDPVALFRAIRRETGKPIRALCKDVPRDLETIISRCMRSRPDERYATAGDLADDLDRFLQSRPMRAAPANPARRTRLWARRHPVGAGTMGFSFLAVLLLLAWVFDLDRRRALAVDAEKHAAVARQELRAQHAVTQALGASSHREIVDDALLEILKHQSQKTARQVAKALDGLTSAIHQTRLGALTAGLSTDMENAALTAQAVRVADIRYRTQTVSDDIDALDARFRAMSDVDRLAALHDEWLVTASGPGGSSLFALTCDALAWMDYPEQTLPALERAIRVFDREESKLKIAQSLYRIYARSPSEHVRALLALAARRSPGDTEAERRTRAVLASPDDGGKWTKAAALIRPGGPRPRVHAYLPEEVTQCYLLTPVILDHWMGYTTVRVERQGVRPREWRTLTALLQHDPSDPKAWEQRGIAASGRGNVHAALADMLRSIELFEDVQQPVPAHLYWHSGKYRWFRGDMEGAQRDFGRCGDHPEGNFTARLYWVLLEAIRNPKSPLIDARLSELPPPLKQTFHAHYFRGLIEIIRGNPERALAAINAMSQSPRRGDAMHVAGVAMLLRGDTNAALRLHQECLEQNPHWILGRFSLVAVYCALGRWEDAVRSGTLATGLDPDWPYAWVNLGVAHLGSGSPKKAIRCFDAALERVPDLCCALLGLGRSLDRTGDHDSARRAYARFLETAPDDPQRASIERRIAELLPEPAVSLGDPK